MKADNVDLDERFTKAHPGSIPVPYIKIMVQDAGCGMDTDTLAHIFEPFFTTKGRAKEQGWD